MILAAALGTRLVAHAGLSYRVLAGIIAASVFVFLALVMATKVLSGAERIVYYHHEIAVMVAAALLLWAWRQPLLPYLDITILGIGAFLACGRLGCLMVGCCHGRPCRWGVRYGEEHAQAGFPSCLVGTRLFPIQAVEAIWVSCTVVVGIGLLWSGAPPGSALAWYVMAYGSGRFVFEFARGDFQRPYWLGFSQPQWLSILLAGGGFWAEAAGALPARSWHVAAFAILAATMIGVSLRRHLQKISSFQLLYPGHVEQVATALQFLRAARLSAAPQAESRIVSVARTSLGIQLSGSEICHGGEHIYHYTVSSAGTVLSERAARLLVSLIRRLDGPQGREKVIPVGRGVFHLLIWPRPENSGKQLIHT